MTALWVAWAISAGLIVIVTGWAGRVATGQLGGILIDTRGRYSLTRLQLALWTWVVVSTVVGVFAARATVRGLDPLRFTIPTEVLGVLGIALGSAVVSTAIKTYKNTARPELV